MAPNGYQSFIVPDVAVATLTTGDFGTVPKGWQPGPEALTRLWQCNATESYLAEMAAMDRRRRLSNAKGIPYPITRRNRRPRR